MNPEDQLELDLTYIRDKMDDLAYDDINDWGKAGAGFEIGDTHEDQGSKIDDIGQRLTLIEKALGIPPKLKVNLDMEEEYPHIKKLREKYELELEKHLTLKLLKPELPY